MHIGKSFRSKKDTDLINFNEKIANIELKYRRTDRDGKIKLEINEKKIFFINDIKQNKISDILGKINVVIFTPDDIDIIKDGPQKRRKFLDMLISSIKPNYVHLLNNYNKTLEQRNNYLRQIKLENKPVNMLDIWDEQLSTLSSNIYEYRKDFIGKIENNLEDFHNLITKSGKEKIKIKYISSSKDEKTFLENLRKTREIDIKRGFTAIGIHRDDFIIYLDGKPVSIFGSQGQQKVAIIALKLSEISIFQEFTGTYPIILLDDVFSELDVKTRNKLIDYIKDDIQVVITSNDTRGINRKFLDSAKIFKVEKGNIVEKVGNNNGK